MLPHYKTQNWDIITECSVGYPKSDMILKALRVIELFFDTIPDQNKLEHIGRLRRFIDEKTRETLAISFTKHYSLMRLDYKKALISEIEKNYAELEAEEKIRLTQLFFSKANLDNFRLIAKRGAFTEKICSEEEPDYQERMEIAKDAIKMLRKDQNVSNFFKHDLKQWILYLERKIKEAGQK
jgi:hypothetical protein